MHLKRTLGYIFDVYRKSWRDFAIVFVAFTIGRIFHDLIPYFLGQLVESLTLTLNSPEARWKEIWWPGFALIALSYVLRGILFQAMVIYTNRIEVNSAAYVRNDLFNKLKRHSLSYFQNRMSGTLAGKVIDASNSFSDMIDMIIFTVYGTIITLCVSFFVLLSISPFLAITLLIWAAFVFVPCIPLARRLLTHSSEEADKRSGLSGLLVDVLTNINAVKSFSRTETEANSYNAAVQEVKKYHAKRLHTDWLINLNQEIGFIVLSASLLFSLLFMVDSGKVSIGDFAVIVPLSIIVSNCVWKMVTSLAGLIENIGSIQTALEEIDQPTEVNVVPSAEDLKVSAGQITFKEVAFGYNNSRSVFENFSLSIAPEEKVALVGPSGAGKSTLTALIQRLYDIESGQILIDGQHISEVTLDSLRRAVSLVPQDITLFNRTLRENIRYGDLTASDADVESAAEKARIHDFILTLPDGYDTLVGERGVKLSGGQRQRIAIARAFLKDAPILILDESTSALDSETEKAIHAGFIDLMKGRTVIAIAHRLSTIRHFDRVLVIEGGKIVGTGPHDELIASSPLYQKLWEMQKI